MDFLLLQNAFHREINQKEKLTFFFFKKVFLRILFGIFVVGNFAKIFSSFYYLRDVRIIASKLTLVIVVILTVFCDQKISLV